MRSNISPDQHLELIAVSESIQACEVALQNIRQAGRDPITVEIEAEKVEAYRAALSERADMLLDGAPALPEISEVPAAVAKEHLITLRAQLVRTLHICGHAFIPEAYTGCIDRICQITEVTDQFAAGHEPNGQIYDDWLAEILLHFENCLDVAIETHRGAREA